GCDWRMAALAFEKSERATMAVACRAFDVFATRLLRDSRKPRAALRSRALSVSDHTHRSRRIYDQGVGEGDGDGRCCSDGGILAGLGLSGEECKWIAFHAVPMRLNTSVMRPEAVSGAPLYSCDCVHWQVTTAPLGPSIVTDTSRTSSFTFLISGYELSRFLRTCSQP